MSEKSKCYWTKDSYCGLELNQNEDEIFIIGSCDSSRREYINTIIEVVENEFKIKAIFAEDLSQHNGYKAFCSNICSPIIRSTLVIVDLSAPNKIITCSNCDQNIEISQQSVNVYWEYGYACGLAKRILLFIDESQIDRMPFDVADTQVEVYDVRNLRNKLINLIEMKLKEPLLAYRYNFMPPPLPATPIGPNDHRIQPIIDLMQYKVVDYYRKIEPEKKRVIRKLIEVLGIFNPYFLEKYGKSGPLVRFIGDYFNMSLEDFRTQLDNINIRMPKKSPLIIAGDFVLKVLSYISEHPELDSILIGKVHGEFDTEIRMHKIFPQDMSFELDFKPALKELRDRGFIRGEPYLGQNSETIFKVPSQAYLKRFVEIYSLDYYFQQIFGRF
ncbi:hypothetical protein LCGC14_0595900 [marine sediment metagenome]|uniref:Uncharacterized protein n=1 Tax=marine sediment metagenome TaxID=412755 RepID=A0A0F9TY79_9ZZZZ